MTATDEWESKAVAVAQAASKEREARVATAVQALAEYRQAESAYVAARAAYTDAYQAVVADGWGDELIADMGLVAVVANGRASRRTGPKKPRASKQQATKNPGPTARSDTGRAATSSRR